MLAGNCIVWILDLSIQRTVHWNDLLSWCWIAFRAHIFLCAGSDKNIFRAHFYFLCAVSDKKLQTQTILTEIRKYLEITKCLSVVKVCLLQPISPAPTSQQSTEVWCASMRVQYSGSGQGRTGLKTLTCKTPLMSKDVSRIDQDVVAIFTTWFVFSVGLSRFYCKTTTAQFSHPVNTQDTGHVESGSLE